MLFMPRQLRQLGLVSGGMEVDLAKAPLADILKWAERFDPVNRTSYLELCHYMPNTLLRDSDSMSMAHGLELRLPFIDHNLVEFLFRIPGTSKLERELPKWLLIEAVHGLLPQQVVRRPKRGFTFPFELWLKKEMRHDMEDVLLDTSANLLTGVDRKFVATVWKDFLAGKATWSRPWSLYVLKRWVDRFLESPPSSLTVDIPDLGRCQGTAQN